MATKYKIIKTDDRNAELHRAQQEIAKKTATVAQEVTSHRNKIVNEDFIRKIHNTQLEIMR